MGTSGMRGARRVLTAGVAALALAGCTSGDTEGRGADATRSPGSSSASSSATPTATRSAAPSATAPRASGSAAPTPAPTPAPTSVRSVPSGSRAVTLLHDGAPPEPGIAENTRWQKAAVKVPVCWQDVPLTGAQEQRAVSALVEMERWTEGLVVFASADQAVRFMELARISVSECSAGDGSPWQGRQQRLSGAWGDGLAISFGATMTQSRTSGPALGETTLVVARVGRAVTYALRGSHGILGETVTARGVAELRPALDHVAPQLCRYTAAGC